MSQELHYTSVPRGLKPGSRGFCTVACTAQMSAPLFELLESLSGYRPVYPVHDPAAAQNPINFSHLRLTVGGMAVSVLSRVGPANLDYSGRSNKYAHHVVLEPNERPEGGPAWLVGHPGFLQEAWDGEPRLLPAGQTPPRGDRPPGVAGAWKALGVDAGWAGVLAESFLADPRRPVFLIFRPGMDLLPLFVEAIALLPPPRRWDVEFSTYFTSLPRGVNCPWRGVVEGSPEAQNALRLPNALTINLCGSLGRAEGRALVHQARGERFQPAGGEDTASAHQPRSKGPASASGRPIPTAGVPPKAPPPGPTIDYEPFRGLAGRPPKRGGASHQPGRTWAMVAGIVAVGLIGMAASVFILLQVMRNPNSKTPDTDQKAPPVASANPERVEPTAIARSPEPAKGDATVPDIKDVNTVTTTEKLNPDSAGISKNAPPKQVTGDRVPGPVPEAPKEVAATSKPDRKTAESAKDDGKMSGGEELVKAPPSGSPKDQPKAQEKGPGSEG